jgi:hypothetical protein
MTATFECTTVNDLAEFSFIAGSVQTITVDFMISGSALDITSSTTKLELTHYGDSTSVLTSNGVVSGSPVNRAVFSWTTANTKDLYGKFQYQPVVIDAFGEEYRPSQGIVNIYKRITA